MRSVSRNNSKQADCIGPREGTPLTTVSLKELSLNGRSFSSLLDLTPGGVLTPANPVEQDN